MSNIEALEKELKNVIQAIYTADEYLSEAEIREEKKEAVPDGTATGLFRERKLSKVCFLVRIS